ncbi:MAG: MATE family efflux transporter [Epulopiscium sp.]|nr:MATE family efflux transporter [Candidatus Epulonipiscium sp.]
MDKQEQLKNENIGKLLFKFSLPAIVGMLVNALYNIVDRIFIGWGVGPLAITGIGVAFPFMTILMAFSMLVGIGATSLISIRLGEERQEDANHILGHAFILLIVVTVIISGFMLYFRDPLLRLFGASDDTFEYAKDYITIILWGALGNTIGFGLNNIIRAEGNPKAAMVTMLLGAILNTVLDPIFIFVFNMGIKGAAYATIIAQFANMIYVLYYFTSSRSLLKLKLRYMTLSSEVILDIFSIGMAPFAVQMAASLVNTLFNQSLKVYSGDLAIGAMGVIMSVSMIFLMPIFGINQGVQPIIGFNYGAKQYHRVKQALKLALITATAFSTIGFLVIQLFPKAILLIFTDNADFIDIGISGLRYFQLLLPVVGAQIISSNYFQAIGRAKIAVVLSLLRQVFILIPMILILPHFFGLTGVWLATPVSDAVSVAITAYALIRNLRRLNPETT